MPTHVGYGGKVGSGSDAENQQETNKKGQYAKGSKSEAPKKEDFPTTMEWIKAMSKWKNKKVEEIVEEKEPETVEEEKSETVEELDEEPKIELSDDKKKVLNQFGNQFGIAEEKLAEASDEEVNLLLKAIQDKFEYEKVQEELFAVEKEAEKLGSSNSLYGVWAYTTVTPKDYYDNSKFSNSIQSKYEFLENLGTEEALQKIEKLKKLEQDAAAYGNFLFDKVYPTKDKLDAINLDEANKTIALFQDTNSTYSDYRKNNAKSAGFKNSKHESSEEIFEADSQKQWEKLATEERDVLQYYTGSYSWAQEPLTKHYYSGGNTPYGGFKKAVELMDSALDKCQYDFDCWVQRGMDDLNINGKSITSLVGGGNYSNLIGTTFRNPAFMSCGSSKGGGFASKSVILNLYCPKGTHMHYIKHHSKYVGEDETIIGRGYEMRIAKIQKKGYKIYIDLDVLVGSDAKEKKQKDLQEAMPYAG